MNSSLALMLYASLAISTSAIATTSGESCYTYSSQMFGPIDLPSLNQESAAESRNASSYDTNDEVRYELPSQIMAQLPSELAAMISSNAGEEPEKYIDNSVIYYSTYSEDGCSAKAANEFEKWEVTFETIEECCDIAFSWDIDGCLSRYVTK